jgi:hypothetical protein
VILHGIKPWHCIVTGIALTIIASILNHFTIENKYAELSALRAQAVNIDTRIDSLWQRNIEAERKKELAALFQGLQADNTDTGISANSARPILPNLLLQYVNSFVSPTETKLNKDSAHAQVIQAIERHQHALKEQIDDLYFEKIVLDKTQAPIEMEISLTRNISLFLQLLGLFSVISKDLVRKM